MLGQQPCLPPGKCKIAEDCVNQPHADCAGQWQCNKDKCPEIGDCNWVCDVGNGYCNKSSDCMDEGLKQPECEGDWGCIGHECVFECNVDSTDLDHDGIANQDDPCPDDPANDKDKDGICGNIDNCPAVYNPEQEDYNNDGVGDACAPDNLLQINVIQKTSESITVNFSIKDYRLLRKQTPEGEFQLLSIPGMAWYGVRGGPMVPQTAVLIELPKDTTTVTAKGEIDVQRSASLDSLRLYPLQDPGDSNHFVYDPAMYQQGSDHGQDTGAGGGWLTDKPYTVGDWRVVTVLLRPLHYDPETGTGTLVTSGTFTLYFTRSEHSMVGKPVPEIYHTMMHTVLNAHDLFGLHRPSMDLKPTYLVLESDSLLGNNAVGGRPDIVWSDFINKKPDTRDYDWMVVPMQQLNSVLSQPPYNQITNRSEAIKEYIEKQYGSNFLLYLLIAADYFDVPPAGLDGTGVFGSNVSRYSAFEIKGYLRIDPANPNYILECDGACELVLGLPADIPFCQTFPCMNDTLQCHWQDNEVGRERGENPRPIGGYLRCNGDESDDVKNHLCPGTTTQVMTQQNIANYYHVPAGIVRAGNQTCRACAYQPPASNGDPTCAQTVLITPPAGQAEPVYGVVHANGQTWIPFRIRYLNGAGHAVLKIMRRADTILNNPLSASHFILPSDVAVMDSNGNLTLGRVRFSAAERYQMFKQRGWQPPAPGFTPSWRNQFSDFFQNMPVEKVIDINKTGFIEDIGSNRGCVGKSENGFYGHNFIISMGNQLKTLEDSFGIFPGGPGWIWQNQVVSNNYYGMLHESTATYTPRFAVGRIPVPPVLGSNPLANPNQIALQREYASNAFYKIIAYENGQYPGNLTSSLPSFNRMAARVLMVGGGNIGCPSYMDKIRRFPFDNTQPAFLLDYYAQYGTDTTYEYFDTWNDSCQVAYNAVSGTTSPVLPGDFLSVPTTNYDPSVASGIRLVENGVGIVWACGHGGSRGNACFWTGSHPFNPTNGSINSVYPVVVASGCETATYYDDSSVKTAPQSLANLNKTTVFSYLGEAPLWGASAYIGTNKTTIGETNALFANMLKVYEHSATLFDESLGWGCMASSVIPPSTYKGITEFPTSSDVFSMWATGLDDCQQNSFGWGNGLMRYFETDLFGDPSMKLRLGQDLDGDGVANHDDNCVDLKNSDQKDSDKDGVGDVCDNCPNTPNPEQRDGNGDGTGNECDTTQNDYFRPVALNYQTDVVYAELGKIKANGPGSVSIKPGLGMCMLRLSGNFSPDTWYRIVIGGWDTIVPWSQPIPVVGLHVSFVPKGKIPLLQQSDSQANVWIKNARQDIKMLRLKTSSAANNELCIGYYNLIDYDISLGRIQAVPGHALFDFSEGKPVIISGAQSIMARKDGLMSGMAGHVIGNRNCFVDNVLGNCSGEDPNGVQTGKCIWTGVENGGNAFHDLNCHGNTCTAPISADHPDCHTCSVIMDPVFQAGATYDIDFNMLIRQLPWFDGAMGGPPASDSMNICLLDRESDAALACYQVPASPTQNIALPMEIANVYIPWDGMLLGFCQKGYGEWWVDNVKVSAH